MNLRSLPNQCFLLINLGFFGFSPIFAGVKFDLQPGEKAVQGQYLVRIQRGAAIEAILHRLQPGLRAVKLDRDETYVVNVPEAAAEVLMTRLAQNPNIEWVEPDRVREVSALPPNDPRYSTQYALSQASAVEAWGSVPGRYFTAGETGFRRVRIAVLDTGIDCTHPDFINAGGTSTDSAEGGQIDLASSRAWVNTVIISSSCAFQDDHGHGTHVAGSIAAAANNATGITGLAYGVELVVYKVLGNTGSGTDSNISAAIRAAADAGVNIISMSLGGTGYSQTMQDAARYAWQRGVLVIAAAGNSNSSSLFFPAGSNYARGISAVDSALNKASFSNFGNGVSLAAAGVSIISTLPTYPTTTGVLNYGTMSGTSMATPHVSAVAGLLVTGAPEMSSFAIFSQIQKTAISSTAGGGWSQNFGFGVVNASSALEETYRASASGRLRGQIVNSIGSPVGNATVTAGSVSVVTGTEGFYHIPLTAGTYTVTVSSWAGSATRNALVVAGTETNLPITVGAATGTLRGEIRGPNGGLAQAYAEIWANGLKVGETPADGTGSYVISLPAGSFEIRASAYGYAADTAIASISINTNTDRDVTLTPQGVITGRVTNSGGVPVADAQVTVANANYVYGAVTDHEGLYVTKGLMPGTYVVSADGGVAGERSQSGVAVALGGSVLVNLVLGSGSLNISPKLAVVNGGGKISFSTNPSTGSIWSVNPTTGAGTINSSGVYTAPTGTTRQTVIIRATSGSIYDQATVLINPILTLTLGKTTTVGGVTVTGNTVSLSSPAPTGGLLVSLISTHSQLTGTLPVVTIPAGATTSSSFSLQIAPVPTLTSVTLTASANGITLQGTRTIQITPPGVSVLTLGATTILGGRSITGSTVTLAGVAGPGGVTVSLTSSDASATVPNTVTVAEGNTKSAAFAVTTSVVSANITVALTASTNGTSKTANLNVQVGLSPTVVLAKEQVKGGTSLSGNFIMLSGPAPTGGRVVTLTSSSSAARIPSSLTIAAGATQISFTITTSAVAALTNAVIKATTDGISDSAMLRIAPPALKSLTTPDTLMTGTGGTGEIVLDGVAPTGGFVVAMTSTNSAAVTVPASVTVPAGKPSVTFTLTSTAVATATTVAVTAVAGTQSYTNQIDVQSSTHVTIASFTGADATYGGRIATYTLTLASPAPANGVAFVVRADNSFVVPPFSVTVPAGLTSVRFNASTRSVPDRVTATITVIGGGATASRALIIIPAILGALSVPTNIVGGTSTDKALTATLGIPWQPAVVTLTSSNPAVLSVPISVTIPNNATTVTFVATTRAVTLNTAITVTATWNGKSWTRLVTVVP